MKKKTPTVLQVLVKARSLIKTKGWTQRQFAVRKDGVGTSSDDKLAAKFCASGACNRAQLELIPRSSTRPYLDNGEIHISFADLAIIELSHAAGTVNIAKWNDKPTRTKAEVLKLFDRAIEKLKTKPTKTRGAHHES